MPPWTKLTSDSAAELAEQAGLRGTAVELLAPDMGPEAYVARLREEKLWTDAVAVLAWGLPIREAVGWACLCDRSTSEEGEDPRHDALLAATERYVYEPSDRTRQAALEMAQAEPDQSSGQLLAMAAGFSGGTVQPSGSPPVRVPTDTIPSMIAGAVMIAATRIEPREIGATYERFLERAAEIAAGGPGFWTRTAS